MSTVTLPAAAFERLRTAGNLLSNVALNAATTRLAPSPRAIQSLAECAAEWDSARDAVRELLTKRAAVPPEQEAPLTDERILEAATREFPDWRIDIQEQFVLRVVRAALASAPRPLTEPDDIWEVSGDYAQGYRKGWQDAQKPANLNTKPPAGSPRSLTEPPTDTFWLIERGPNQGQLPHVWWQRSKTPLKCDYKWIEAAVEATRFATKAEAEAAIASEYLTHCVATSHSIIPALAPHPLVSPSEPPIGLSKRSAELIFETLQYYANVTTYQGERIGGVLQGCPRGPAPTAHELADEARRVLDKVEPELRAAYASLSPAPSITGEPVPKIDIRPCSFCEPTGDGGYECNPDNCPGDRPAPDASSTVAPNDAEESLDHPTTPPAAERAMR